MVSRVADISGTLSMCRRAGKLTCGMDEVKNCCRRFEAKAVLVTRDFSDNSYNEICRCCEQYKTPLFVVDMTMDDVGMSLGKRFGVMAVCDAGFAGAIKKKLAQ